LTFRLVPDPRFVYELAGLVPVPAGIPDRDVGTTPVPSTGPYRIQTYVPGKLLVFARNPYFHVWSPAARPDGYADEIVYRGTDLGTHSQDAAAHDVLVGKADLVTEWKETPTFRAFAARRPLQVHPLAEQATELVFLNVRQPPFDDIRVRRALNFAVDRNRVAAMHGAGFARPTCQVVPPTVPGYRPYCPYTVEPDRTGSWRAPDLARARALIRASGTRGTTVVVWSVPYFRKEARYLVVLLRQLGYHARLHSLPNWQTYEHVLDRTPSAQAGFITWFSTPSLAADTLSTVGCRFRPNWTRFCDLRIDARVARLAKQEPADPTGTAGRAAAIDREITNRAPWVPLLTPRMFALTSSRVGNYQVNGGALLVDQLWVR
jgi:peptide/nickel transport system substrate-binding protein